MFQLKGLSFTRRKLFMIQFECIVIFYKEYSEKEIFCRIIFFFNFHKIINIHKIIFLRYFSVFHIMYKEDDKI